MRHRLHYVGKNPDFEDLGQETLTLADIATEEEDDMIGPAAVVALKGDIGNEVGCGCTSIDSFYIPHYLQRCADCRALEPEWASVSYGSFICLRCAAHHRSLGVGISKVRSITLDRWTVDEIRRMQAGGNERLRAMFREAGVPSDLSIEDRYRSSTAEAYRMK
jgi:ADP-ribosylation factor GTPase-activating protein 1